MSWMPMREVMQFVDANAALISGHVFKAYEPGTTTNLQVAIDNSGGSLQSTVTFNSKGVPEVSGNQVILYADRKYKWAIFADATDATANSNPVFGFFDNVPNEATLEPIEKTSSFTLDSTYACQFIVITGSNNVNITVPTEASDTLPAGFTCVVRHDGTGTLTIVEESGVTVKPPQGGTLGIPSDGTAQLYYPAITTDRWMLFGQVNET